MLKSLIANERLIAERLRFFCGQLARHPLVEVVEHSVGRPVRPERLVRCRGKVPDGLLSLYGVMDGFAFEWKYRGDPRPFAEGNGGRFHLPTLARNARTFSDDYTFEMDLVPFVVDLAPRQRSWLSSIVNEAGEVLLYDGDYLEEILCGVDTYIEQAIAHCFTADWLLHHRGYGSSNPPSYGIEARQRLGLGDVE